MRSKSLGNRLEKWVGKVHCMDCLEGMKQLPDGCVDLVWTDPPYNVGKDYGIYKDNLPDKDYLNLMAATISEMKRIAQAICMLIPKKYALNFWNMLGPEYQQIIISFSPEGARRWRFTNQFTFLLTNAKPVLYCKNVWHNVQMPGMGYFFKEETFGHPGYTSEDLTARVIKYFSKEGDLLLDPYGGSGTTAKMCKKSNRRFIVFETNPDYVKICNQRLKQEVFELKSGDHESR